ncbi:hypothetical protein C8R44DRAFT_723473 [Mycena epipterygia]|nr:hypothetical protein C8R44DRAFT_723473 [Mycena epipterygia]
MLLVLPVLSFICAGLLAVFLTILIRRLTVNTSNMALILWLLFGNVVHTSTRSSGRPTSRHRFPCGAISSKRLHTLFDVALCYVLPLLYMTHHFAVQDHRFDLVRDFGCSAFSHRSTPAMSIKLLPPLISCSASGPLDLAFRINIYFRAVLAVWNCARLSSERSTSHLSACSSVLVSHFVRHLFKSILLTTTVLLVTLIPPLTTPRYDRWPAFRANFKIFFVVTSSREVGAAHVAWWAIPVVSIVYLVLSLVLGDGLVDAFEWIWARLCRTASREARPQLSFVTL